MSPRAQRWCIWCGPIFTALFAVGFWFVADFVPPPSPSDTADQSVQLFAADQDRIRLGMMLSILGASFYFPFVAVLSSNLRRLEGDYSPMAYLQLAGGVGSWCVFFFPLMSIQAANYRSGSDPGVVQMLNDVAWLQFIGGYAPPMVQCVAIAVAILQDKGASPGYPRWVGYFNIWVAVVFAPGAMPVFFKTGPLAWNGLFCWWIPAAAFFGWIVVMSWVQLRTLAAPSVAHPAVGQPASPAEA